MDLFTHREHGDDVSITLQETKWTKMLSDGCLFILKDGDDIVGIAGVHVDDFLIGGKDEGAYRWGKWEHDGFTFAGCRVRPMPDMSIQADQIRGALGALAWRSSQSSPQYQADVSLMLNEVPYATISTVSSGCQQVDPRSSTNSTASHLPQPKGSTIEKNQ